MKRLLASALLVLLCAANLPAMARGKYVTIAELYEQTRDGWQAEYTAPPHKKTGIAGYNGELKIYPAGTFEEIYHARLVWVFRGFAPMETAGALLEQQIEDQRNRLEPPSPIEEIGLSGGRMIINAQTGKLINFTSDNDKLDDVFPGILQWRDVK